MEWFWTWLRQPSSLRVVNILCGLLGYAIAPELWEQIIYACIAVYMLIDGLYNKQPPA